MNKLFEHRIIALVRGAVSIGDDKKIDDLLTALGFSPKIKHGSSDMMETKNFYAGFFTCSPYDDTLKTVKDRIHSKCDDLQIGMFDYILIDITESDLLKSIWHDGFY